MFRLGGMFVICVFFLRSYIHGQNYKGFGMSTDELQTEMDKKRPPPATTLLTNQEKKAIYTAVENIFSGREKNKRLAGYHLINSGHLFSGTQLSGHIHHTLSSGMTISPCGMIDALNERVKTLMFQKRRDILSSTNQEKKRREHRTFLLLHFLKEILDTKRKNFLQEEQILINGKPVWIVKNLCQ